ncbi:MAG: TPM domain-containing protein [Pseudomonadota bacterium]
MRQLSPFAAGFAALLLASCATEDEAASDNAAAAPALELTGRVVDAADVLAASTEATLTETLEALESDTGVQLVVATTPDLEGREIDAYSFDLGNAWGLGSAERNDGLLLLVAPNERQVRIEVGIGLESKVTNLEASEIIHVAMMPHLRRGDFSSAMIVGVDSLIEEVEETEVKEAA